MKNKKKVLIFDHKEKINSCIEKIKNSYENYSYPGIAVVLDKDKKLLGLVTEGDIRRNLNSKINITPQAHSLEHLKKVLNREVKI